MPNEKEIMKLEGLIWETFKVFSKPETQYGFVEQMLSIFVDEFKPRKCSEEVGQVDFSAIE